MSDVNGHSAMLLQQLLPQGFKSYLCDEYLDVARNKFEAKSLQLQESERGHEERAKATMFAAAGAHLMKKIGSER